MDSIRIISAFVMAPLVAGVGLGAYRARAPAEPATRSPSRVSSAASPVTAAGMPTPSAAGDPIEEAKRIALSAPPGSSSLDREILAAEKAAQHLPRKEDYWIVLGQAWVRKAREALDPGFYVNASAAATVALDVSPGSKMGFDLQALVLLNDHKFDEARAVEEKVLSSDPDDAQALGSLSDALLELGRFEEAATAAQRMVDLKPNLPSYSRASYFRWLQGDGEAAKTFARRAIDASAIHGDVEPRAWEIVQAALLFWHEGDYEGAGAGFEQALALKSDYAPALVGMGRVAIARGDGGKAAEWLGRAYAQSPLVETAWLLGDARALSGDPKGAAEAYALVEARGRANDPRTLSLFWSTKGVHATESLALAEAESRVRGDTYTKDALAWALYRSGRYLEARAASDQATRLGTNDARLVYHAGAIRIAAGDAGSGARLVARALELNPKFDLTGAAEAEALVGHAR